MNTVYIEHVLEAVPSMSRYHDGDKKSASSRLMIRRPDVVMMFSVDGCRKLASTKNCQARA